MEVGAEQCLCMLSTHEEQEPLKSFFLGGYPNIEIGLSAEYWNIHLEPKNPGKHNFASTPHISGVVSKNIKCFIKEHTSKSDHFLGIREVFFVISCSQTQMHEYVT